MNSTRKYRTVLVTGSGGLIGSEVVRHFSTITDRVIGIDNDMRSHFFGPDASTQWAVEDLQRRISNYEHCAIDIRDLAAIRNLIEANSDDLDLVVHTAAQPSHDWAARDPLLDFDINARSTLNLLEALRQTSPSTTFIFTSTNKVYGDTPNSLPLVESMTRWDLSSAHEWSTHGIPESMSIDRSIHSLFGASKLSADLICQEYGLNHGLNTGIFRGGCLTGPGHSGAQLHGFLAYLMRATVTGMDYQVFGYKGKQVRDNIHAKDLVNAFVHFAADPRPGAVYNIGGGPEVNCSMLEAIELCQEISGRPLSWSYVDSPRVGDHQWWISDTRKFKADYPGWSLHYGLKETLEEIYSHGLPRWRQTSRV